MSDQIDDITRNIKKLKADNRMLYNSFFAVTNDLIYRTRQVQELQEENKRLLSLNEELREQRKPNALQLCVSCIKEQIGDLPIRYIVSYDDKTKLYCFRFLWTDNAGKEFVTRRKLTEDQLNGASVSSRTIAYEICAPVIQLYKHTNR